ncbi:glycerol-3-phosphate 1-O-acyltransferase PlsY [Candidatus Sumerlaeota bacterium]|nr:glycerol-3-phosphate 1-O-acyltransferase PlsY [Candidatus Sumerlaeota bacterium]
MWTDEKFWLLLGAAYLLGSISPSYVLGRLRGVDLRQHGSGNLGMTNAMRVLGKPAGVTVLCFDVAKGFVPAFCFVHWLDAQLYPVYADDIYLLQLAFGLAAVIGHCFPFYLGFRGGKGILAGAGTFLALAPEPVLIALVVALSLMRLTRYVSIGSMCSGVTLAIATTAWNWNASKPWLIVAAWLIAFFAIYTHRTNIQRLLSGTESKIGETTGKLNGEKVKN